QRATAVALALVAANLVIWLPVARDDRVRTQAMAAARRLHDGDLVIGPGHGWDEYVGFYGAVEVTPLPLVYSAGAVRPAALPATLARAVAQARATGHAVVLARLADDGDVNGWKELRAFALTPANARALLPPGRAVALGDGLERWDSP